MELKDLIISMVVIGLVTIGFLIVAGAFSSEYGVAVGNDYDANFNYINNMSVEYNRLSQDSLQNASTDATAATGFFLFSGQMWGALKLMMKTPYAMYAMLGTIFSSLGIGWALNGVVIIIGVSVMFMLIWMFWRFRQ